MELSQLNYFKVASRHKNFTQAAEELHMSQPALSISISKLEKELGTVLLDRGGSSLQPTAAGRAFLFWCNQAQISIDSGVREVRDICGAGGGKVCVAVSEAVFIKHLARDFLSSHKDASLQCYMLTNSQMCTAIHEGTIDFVVSRGPLYGSDIFWSPVCNDFLTVLMSTKNPLSNRTKLRFEDLADEYFIIGDIKYDVKSFVYERCYSVGFTPKVRYEGHEADAASMLLSLEHTVMLAYSSTTYGVRADMVGIPELVSLPLVDAPSEPIGIGLRPSRYQSSAAQDFYEMVRSFFSSLPNGP